MIETLEQRRLLSFSVSGGVLTVTGTSNGDHIQITRDGTNLTIHEGATSHTTPLSGVQKIVINGQGGNDDLSLALGPDHGVNLPSTLNGGDGDDRLGGGDGKDVLNGGAGKDQLNGARGDDVLNGGDGDDRMTGGPGADVFNGGGGIDAADYHEAHSNLVITLDNTNNDGSVGDSTHPAEHDNVHSDVENVIGGGGNDKITGSSANNRLVGGPGNDSLSGLAGNDTLDGGPGNDSLSGGDGNDFLIGHDNAKDTLNGGGGTDSSSDDTVDILTRIEHPHQANPQQPPPPPPPGS